uniref:Uncharacterized protein n=1 Tax=Arundo donax TaxID=35708 RepID=A0A0A8XR13_ARUDO
MFCYPSSCCCHFFLIKLEVVYIKELYLGVHRN